MENNEEKQQVAISDEEAKTLIGNAEFICTFGKTPDAELSQSQLDKENEKWISVRVPFSGTYESIWSEGLSRIEEDIYDLVKYNPGSLDDILEDVKQSPSWEQFTSQLINREELEEYLAGERHLSLDIPVDMESILEANFDAMRDILDYTEASHIWAKATWKWDEMWSPKEYNFFTDQIYYYLDTETWKKVAWKSVLHSKWYKQFAKWRTTPCDGYMPGLNHKYENYFDKIDGWCTEAVLLFWLSMGAYACSNHIAPIKHQAFHKVDDDLYFNDSQGINYVGLLTLLDTRAYEDWCPSYSLTNATIF